MVVDENHRGGGFSDDRIENFARVNKRGGKRAFGNFYFTNFTVFIVEQDNVEKLAHFPAEIFSEMLIDVFRCPERLAGLPFLAADAPGDFQTRLDLSDLRGTDAFDLCQLACRSVLNSFEAAEFTQQPASVVERAFACARVAISQNDGEQLGFAERLRALGKEFFSRTIFLGPILDGLI